MTVVYVICCLSVYILQRIPVLLHSTIVLSYLQCGLLIPITTLSDEVFIYRYRLDERTFLEHLSLPPVIWGDSIAQAFVFCIMICRSLIVLFLLTIVLSVCLFCDLCFFPVRALAIGYGKNFHNFYVCCL